MSDKSINLEKNFLRLAVPSSLATYRESRDQNFLQLNEFGMTKKYKAFSWSSSANASIQNAFQEVSKRQSSYEPASQDKDIISELAENFEPQQEHQETAHEPDGSLKVSEGSLQVYEGYFGSDFEDLEDYQDDEFGFDDDFFLELPNSVKASAKANNRRQTLKKHTIDTKVESTVS